MNRYRMEIEYCFLNETLDYYFLAKNDDRAKTYLALKMQKVLKQEQQEMEYLYIAYDGLQIVAIQKQDVFLTGRLFCLPNKFQELDDREVNQQTIEAILDGMKQYCKSIKMGIPRAQDKGRKKKQGTRRR